jgi:hypothetical protein
MKPVPIQSATATTCGSRQTSSAPLSAHNTTWNSGRERSNASDVSDDGQLTPASRHRKTVCVSMRGVGASS